MIWNIEWLVFRAIDYVDHVKVFKKTLFFSSKDTLIKFWDLTTQHCFFTIAAVKGDVWDFAIIKNYSQLIIGSVELELQVYDIKNTENEVCFVSPDFKFASEHKILVYYCIRKYSRRENKTCKSWWPGKCRRSWRYFCTTWRYCNCNLT